MASRKKKKCKNLFEKAGICIINTLIFLMTMWFGFPLAMFVHSFYSEVLKTEPHKTRPVPKRIRKYYASYQDSNTELLNIEKNK